GRTSAGELALIGTVEAGVVAVFFSPEGRLLRSESRDVDLSPARGLPLAQLWQRLGLLLDEACQSWRQEVGFVPQTIRFFAFWLPEHQIGAAELPQYLALERRDPAWERDEALRRRWHQAVAEFKA